MKKILSLITFILVVAFSSNLFALSIFAEAGYTDKNADIYAYGNVPAFLHFCKKNQISVDDIAYLVDDSAGDTGREAIKNALPNLLDVLLVANSRNLEKKDGYIIFIKEKGGVYSFLRNSSLKQKKKCNRFNVYQLSQNKKTVFTRIENITVLGSSDEVYLYLKNRKNKKNNRSSYLDTARKGAVKKTVYFYIGLTGFLKDIFNRAMNKAMKTGKRFGSSLDHNVFIKSIYNVESVVFSSVLKKKASVYGELRGGSSADGERLMMLSHFAIVGTSFAVPFVETLSRSFGGKKIKTDEESLIKVQEFFGRIKTQQLKKGVNFSFRFKKNEILLFVRGIKESIEKNKKKIADKKYQILIDKFFAAIKAEDKNKIEASLKNIKDINVKNAGETPLDYAAKNGFDKSVVFLIKNGADINMKAGTGNCSPVCTAVSNNRLSTVKILLERGADSSFKDSRGYSLLHIAVEKKNVEMVNLLLKNKLKVDTPAIGGITSLHIASEEGALELVKILIKAGADRALKDDLGTNCMDKAIGGKHQDVIDYYKSLAKSK